jgi:D-alanyl-D-alanine carboxypeptidase
MTRCAGRHQRYFRWGTFTLAVLVAASAISSDADARTRHRRHRAPAAAAYQPPYASIVVDANSGKVMEASNADSLRHPASLTKMMTLYLLFERLEAGKIRLDSEMPVSAHAAAQAPSKLGLKPGETIKVETAIRAIVTKSANDVAVIISEALGGDESDFARMMTAKARALGMTHTTYRNASGLPDDGQITTARDQALLGRALQDRFPKYFHYFSTRAFTFQGRTVRGHNRLLGNVDGVDGIKTGYIRASGFNIVTSVNRGKRHIVAVVFGGRTARARDARVIDLISSNINVASVTRTAPPVVEATALAHAKPVMPAKPPTPARDPRDDIAATAAAGPASAPAAPVQAASVQAASAADAPSPGSTAPIKPLAVKTVAVHAGQVRTAALSPLPSDSRRLMPAPATANPASVTNIATVKSDLPPPPPGAAPGILGVLPAKAATDGKTTRGAQLASAGPTVPLPAATPEPAAKPMSKPHGGWMIQVGAFPDEDAAKQRLSAAKTKARDQLGQASPFTEKIAKGDKSLFRARFAGLDKGQAENACKHLKRSEIPCMLLRN